MFLWNYLAILIECFVCDKWTNVLKVVQMVLAEASHYASVFLFTNPYEQKCPLCSKTQDKGKHLTLTPNKVLWKDWNWKTVSWHGIWGALLAYYPLILLNLILPVNNLFTHSFFTTDVGSSPSVHVHIKIKASTTGILAY